MSTKRSRQKAGQTTRHGYSKYEKPTKEEALKIEKRLAKLYPGMYAKHAKALKGKPSKVKKYAAKLYRSAKKKVGKLMPGQGTTKATVRTKAIERVGSHQMGKGESLSEELKKLRGKGKYNRSGKKK